MLSDEVLGLEMASVECCHRTDGSLQGSIKMTGRLLTLIADYYPKAPDVGLRRASVNFISHQTVIYCKTGQPALESCWSFIV